MPLEKAPPGSSGFSNNIAEMRRAGHPEDQAVAAAYRAAGERDCSRLDALFAAADALYSRADAMENGCWDQNDDLSGISPPNETVNDK